LRDQLQFRRPDPVALLCLGMIIVGALMLIAGFVYWFSV
jgi:hypothetical protein